MLTVAVGAYSLVRPGQLRWRCDGARTFPVPHFPCSAPCPNRLAGIQPFAELARGAATVVYKGYQRDPGRFVLLKVVRPEGGEDEGLVGRFEEEAAARGAAPPPERRDGARRGARRARGLPRHRVRRRARPARRSSRAAPSRRSSRPTCSPKPASGPRRRPRRGHPPPRPQAREPDPLGGRRGEADRLRPRLARTVRRRGGRRPRCAGRWPTSRPKSCGANRPAAPPTSSRSAPCSPRCSPAVRPSPATPPGTRSTPCSTPIPPRRSPPIPAFRPPSLISLRGCSPKTRGTARLPRLTCSKNSL